MHVMVVQVMSDARDKSEEFVNVVPSTIVHLGPQDHLVKLGQMESLAIVARRDPLDCLEFLHPLHCTQPQLDAGSVPVDHRDQLDHPVAPATLETEDNLEILVAPEIPDVLAT